MHTLSPNAVKHTRFHSSRRLAVKSEDGVTLLELITSIAVIGVLVLIVVLSFGGVTADAKQAAVDAAASSAYKMGAAALVRGEALESSLDNAQTKDVVVNSNNATIAENLCVTARWIDNEAITSQKGTCGGINAPEGNEETTNAVWSYSCGTMTLNITQQNIDQSLANNAAYDSGDLSSLIDDSTGVSLILDLSTYRPITTTDTKPLGVLVYNAATQSMIAEASGSAGACMARDYRISTTGTLYMAQESSTFSVEGMVVEVAGEKVFEEFTDNGTAYSIIRRVSSNATLVSNVSPYTIHWLKGTGELATFSQDFSSGALSSMTRSINGITGAPTDSCQNTSSVQVTCSTPMQSGHELYGGAFAPQFVPSFLEGVDLTIKESYMG